MKESKLGDFEETLMLITGILGEEAYAFKIAEEYEVQTKKPTSIGAVHSTLERLGKKGFLKSAMGEPTAERGGRRKRIYQITGEGHKALELSRDLKVSLWKQFPAFAGYKFQFT